MGRVSFAVKNIFLMHGPFYCTVFGIEKIWCNSSIMLTYSATQTNASFFSLRWSVVVANIKHILTLETRLPSEQMCQRVTSICTTYNYVLVRHSYSTTILSNTLSACWKTWAHDLHVQYHNGLYRFAQKPSMDCCHDLFFLHRLHLKL